MVGEKFENDMPAEAMSIVLANGMPMLTFNFTVTEREIAAFLNGASSFGLFYEQNVLFFLFKIEGFLDWSDLAFTIHLAGDEEVDDKAYYLPFHLVLIDPKTKVVKGLRMVTVSPAFRTMISGILLQQSKQRFDTVDYFKRIELLYKSYPSAIDMLKKAPIIGQGGSTLPKK